MIGLNYSIQTGENNSTKALITGRVVYNKAYNQILQTKETNTANANESSSFCKKLVKTENPRTLGLCDFASPWTFVKTTARNYIFCGSMISFTPFLLIQF